MASNKIMNKKSRITLVVALVMILAIGSMSYYYLSNKSQRFEDILVFGDSLSDVGNFYIINDKKDPKEPYYEGRFSNGPVWIEVFAEKMGLPAVKPSLAGGKNYAFGGARTGIGDREGKPDIGSQIDEYLKKTNGKIEKRQLIVVSGGCNDFLKGNPIKTIPNTIRNIEKLTKAGGKTFLVSNFPPLGCLPAFKHELPLIIEASLVECLECAVDPQIQKYLESKVGTRIANYLKKWIPSVKEYLPSLKRSLPGIAEEFAKHLSTHTGSEITFENIGLFALNSATDISQMYNDYLRLALEDLQRRYKIKIYQLDLNKIFQEIVDNPQKFGIEYIDVSALDPATHELIAGDVNHYLFFDAVHPVSKTHKVIGESASKLFK